MNKTPIWVWVSLVLTTLLGLFSLWQRHQVESLNKAVALVADAETLATLAATQGLTLDEALKKLKEAGLGGVVVSEETIGDLVAAGRAALSPGVVRLTTEEPGLRERIARGLVQRFGIFVAPGSVDVGIGSLDPALVRGTSVGIDPGLASQVRANDLIVVARLGNPLGATAKYVTESIGWAAEHGVGFFLPQGEQVLGRRAAMKDLADALRSRAIYYASPEFAKIGGDAGMVAANPDWVIRLHSAQVAELDKLGPAEAIERYAKAAVERNQRILLVRPMAYAGDQPLSQFSEFLSGIRDQIIKEGLSLDTPHPFKDSAVPTWLFLALALAALPALVHVFSHAGLLRWPLTGLAVLLAATTWADAGRPYFALVCAVSFPVLAFRMVLDDAPGAKGPMLVPLVLRTLWISWVGGLCVGGLLNGLEYFVKAEAFSGVKLAHFLPIGIIGAMAFARGTDVRQALKSPVFWGQAALGGLLLVAFAFMASRTGNDGPAGVSGLELKLRSLLDQLLYVRPRTKEFLIGHPALVLGVGLLMRRAVSPGWLAIAMMVGAIGATSVVNTMCHLHTPVSVSLARILVGIVVGGIIGAIGWGVLGRLLPQRS